MTTTCDPLTSPDALALLAAVDARDNVAALALADLLEEAGRNDEAAAWRLATAYSPVGEAHIGWGRFGWGCEGDRYWRHQDRALLPPAIFAALRGGTMNGIGLRLYPCRSAAFVDLVATLEGGA